MNIVFFGSFQHYSALILKSLITDHRSLTTDRQSLTTVSAVVTTPPTPMGRQKILTKSPVHLLAEAHHIPVFTPSSLTSRTLLEVKESPSWSKPDFFITAGYGKMLPQSWLDYPTLGSLNLHFSLLPKYRGANPAEWAIMCGETTTGITLITMSDKLDSGDILAQAEIPIIGDTCPEPSRRDTRETLYQKLYKLGAKMLPQWLIEVAANGISSAQICQATAPTMRALQNAIAKPIKQPPISPTPYAALLKRQDGFLPWPTLQKTLQGESLKSSDFPSPKLQTAANFSLSTNHCSLTTFLHSLPRAFAGYPSLWTIIPTAKGDKRMKILSFNSTLNTKHLTLNLVQIEGQQPAAFNQIKNLII